MSTLLHSVTTLVSLSENHYGCLSGLKLIEDTKRALYGHMYVGMLSRDLSNTFDCLWRLLLCELNASGFSRDACAITRSYLPDSKVHGANIGLIWGRQDPGGPMLVPWTLLSGYITVCNGLRYLQRGTTGYLRLKAVHKDPFWDQWCVTYF